MKIANLLLNMSQNYSQIESSYEKLKANCVKNIALFEVYKGKMKNLRDILYNLQSTPSWVL